MATNLFKLYETDKKREVEGVEIDIDGAVFICRRAGGNNRLFRATISTLVGEVADSLKSADQGVQLDAETIVTQKAFAKTVVLGWRGVLDRNDQPWEYTAENFLELMAACPDLWDELRIRARDLDNFRAMAVKEAGEELGKPSSGTSDGAST